MYPSARMLAYCVLLAVHAVGVHSLCEIADVEIKCMNETLEAISNFPNKHAYTTLTVNGTELPVLPEEAFPYDNVETLAVTKCSVTSVHRNAFANLRFLVNLDLSDNAIEHLPSTTFAHNTRLKTLVLRSNVLEHVQSSLFETTRWLTRLDVSNNNFYNFDFLSLAKLKRLRSLQIESAEISHISNYRSHSPYNVQHLSLKNNRLETIEESYFVMFSKVVVLDLSDNSIDTINENAFRDLIRVEKLYMNDNVISDLPPRLFRHMVRLTELNLNGNLLEMFSAASFDYVARLEFLHLRNNFIKEIIPRNSSGPTASKLISLDLSDNYFETLPAYGFGGLERLKTLRVESAFVESLDENAFATNVALEVLNLTENLINWIPSETFSPLTSLKVLDLTENANIALPADVFHSLTSLEILHNSRNCLDRPNFDIYRSLTRLETLSMSANISATDADPTDRQPVTLKNLVVDGIYCDVYVETALVFAMPMLEIVEFHEVVVNFTHEDVADINVRRLTVERCRLSGGLPDSAFAAMHALVYLRFSNTAVERLPAGVFASQRNLRALVLRSCDLEHVDDDAFDGLDSLLELDLSGNRLSVVSPDTISSSRLPSLTTLSLRWNNITRLPRDMLDGTFVDDLDVSMNALTHLPDGFFDGTFLKRFEFYGNPWWCACLDEIYDTVFQYSVEYETFGFLDGKLPACMVDVDGSCVKDGDVGDEALRFSEAAKEYIDIDDEEFRGTVSFHDL